MTAFHSAVLALALFAQGVQLPSPPRGFSGSEADMVVDQANVLSSEAVARMNRLIFAVKSASGGEIVVVTLPDIGGRDVGDFALAIGREWKVGSNAAVGDRSRNAGVVVLLIPKETASDGRGQISIQTGQGAEGFITDAMAGDIRREATAFLRQADYATALELITQRVAQRYAAEFGFALDSAVVDPRFVQSTGQREVSVSPLAALALFIFLLLFFVAMANASRRRGLRGCLYAMAVDSIASGHRRGSSSWGGGGFGGGSWGGGGGGFGGFGGGGGFSGGGSSGSW